MVAVRSKRRSLRIAALVAAAGPAEALVTACSAPGGPASAGAAVPGHAASAHRAHASGTAHTGSAPAADVRAAAVSPVTATPSAVPSATVPATAPVSPAAASPAGAAAAAGAHRVTLVNRVTQTIWVAAQNPAHPLARTGWTLKPGESWPLSFP